MESNLFLQIIMMVGFMIDSNLFDKKMEVSLYMLCLFTVFTFFLLFDLTSIYVVQFEILNSSFFLKTFGDLQNIAVESCFV